MRKMKFRVWSKQNNVMLDDNFYLSLRGDLFQNDDLDYKSKDNFAIMQYIGSKDKNDREIYEGDLISFTNDTRLKGGGYTRKKYVALINYEEKYCSYRANYIDVTGERQNLTLDWLNVKEVEVIGNIYENSELL